MPWKDLVTVATQVAFLPFFYRVQLRASEESARSCERADEHLMGLERTVTVDVSTRTEPPRAWRTRSLVDGRPVTLAEHPSADRAMAGLHGEPDTPGPGRWRRVELARLVGPGPNPARPGRPRGHHRSMPLLAEARAGALAVAPMLLGVVPFGLVAGAVPVAEGLGGWAAVGLSSIVFAGASQLAAAEVLADGGSVVVAVLAAWVVNLRLVLYSASLAPYLSHERLRRRLGVAYLLTDQAYALSVTRWSAGTDPESRLPYYLGAGTALWLSWQTATVVGVLVGGAVPESIPLDFAVPLVFLVLLVPLLTTRPAVVAAVVGGTSSVIAAEVGAGPLALLVGAGMGVGAGVVADLSADRDEPPPDHLTS